MTTKPNPVKEVTASVYCPLCTHTVPAQVLLMGRRSFAVKAGQKCPRCSSSLDASRVLEISQAA